MSISRKHSHDYSGPIGFWFWNDELDKSVIDQQLDEFQAQGFSAVVSHPRDGLLTPYLSSRWFEMLSYAVDACAKRGLKIWFYDENPYPSGTAGGLLLNRYPYLMGHTLTFKHMQVKPEDGAVKCKLPVEGTFLKAYAATVNSDGQILDEFADISNHAGLVSGTWEVEGVRCQGYGPAFRKEDTCRPFWRAAATGDKWELHWQTDDNRSVYILAVGLSPRHDPRHGYYVDLLNPETTQRFIELTHQATATALGEEKFRQFSAGFTDEPILCGPYPWTKQLAVLYEEKYSADLLVDLPHLAMQIDDSSRLVRYRYRRLIGDLWQQSFIEPIAQWFQQYDIPLTGHISPEEDPFGQTLLATNWAGLTATMHWPGCDHITSTIGIPPDTYKTLGIKLTSSLAHQNNSPHVMCETLGVSGEDLNIHQMKKAVDWLALCGIDTFVLHGEFMSLDGHRKREAPPSIFYQAPYWNNMKTFSKYIDSMAQWNQNSKPANDIAVLYPTSAFESWLPVEDKPAQKLAKHMVELVGRLHFAGLNFDLITDRDLAKAECPDSSNNTTFTVGAMQYRTLIVPNLTLIDSEASKAIENLISAEISVQSLVKAVQINRQDTEHLILPNCHSSIDELTQFLTTHYRAWLRLDQDANICVQTRTIDQARQHCIWNPSDRPLKLIIDESHCKSYTLPDQNQLHAVSAGKPGEVILTLEPWQTVIILDDAPEYAVAPKFMSFTKCDEANWTESWTLTPNDANSLVLSEWTLELPDGTSSLVRLPARSGVLPWGLEAQTVKLHTEFVIDGSLNLAELWWDRSTFGGPYELRINGIKVEDVQTAKKYDIHDRFATVTHLLQPGSNKIDVRVGPIAAHQPAMLDPIRLNGQFVIRQSDDDTPHTIVKPCGKSLQIDAPEDWCALGFPHYSGTMTYRGIFSIDKTSSRIYLQAPPQQYDSFELIVNSKSISQCCWSPFRCEITPHIVQGPNTIDIVVSNTLINRIESQPCPSGLLGSLQILQQDRVLPKIQYKTGKTKTENTLTTKE